MCVVCVWMSEGQLDLAGLLMTGGSDSTGQRASVTSTGTPRPGMALEWSPYHLEGRRSRGQEHIHSNTQTDLRHHSPAIIHKRLPQLYSFSECCAISLKAPRYPQ